MGCGRGHELVRTSVFPQANMPSRHGMNMPFRLGAGNSGPLLWKWTLFHRHDFALSRPSTSR